MAIAQTNYLQKAHRLSEYNVSATVGEIHAGQFFHLDDNGEWVVADGTRRAYPTLNNRFSGAGLGPQFERLEGRDDVSRSGKIACLFGGYELGTDQYDDTQTFEVGTALTVGANGQLTPYLKASMDPAFIVGYVTQKPAETGDFLRFQGQ